MEFAHLEDTDFFLAANKLITDKTKNITNFYWTYTTEYSGMIKYSWKKNPNKLISINGMIFPNNAEQNIMK